MTPKEKAKELIDKFHIKVHDREGTSAMNEFEAKQCALIAVDEILELTKRPTYNPFDWNEITGTYYDKYWQEVKEEIEKL